MDSPLYTGQDKLPENVLSRLVACDANMSRLNAGFTELSLLEGAHGNDPQLGLNQNPSAETVVENPLTFLGHTEPFLNTDLVENQNDSPTRTSSELYRHHMSCQQSPGWKPTRSLNVWDTRHLREALEQVPPGQGTSYKRRNVVRLCWTGDSKHPLDREHMLDLLFESMGFQPKDIFALISLPGSEFDVSFKLPESLHKFWCLYKTKRATGLWRSFRAIRISRPDVKCVTISFHHESVPPDYIINWLNQHCTVLTPLRRVRDEFGIWTGAWKVQVKLNVVRHVIQHLPTSFFIQDERGEVSYAGQPCSCYECGSATHFARACPLKKWKGYENLHQLEFVSDYTQTVTPGSLDTDNSDPTT